MYSAFKNAEVGLVLDGGLTTALKLALVTLVTFVSEVAILISFSVAAISVGHSGSAVRDCGFSHAWLYWTWALQSVCSIVPKKPRQL